MPYHLVHGDHDLRTVLRRVATEELDAALARLHGRSVGAADVHDVRKRVKKLRALLRLLRFGLPAFDCENAALREAAAHLSAQRDADVRLATFDRLAGPHVPALLAPLRAVLTADRGRVPEVTDPVPAARAALALVRDRVETWHLDGSDGDILRAGLAQTRRHARRAMVAAEAEATAEAMHDWRKRVKDGWYQARLLSPIRPHILHPVVEAAGALGEDLGVHHDLAVLADHVAAVSDSAVTPAARSDLLDRIRPAQAVLEARAFAAGATLLAEKPKAMARHWTDWWQEWRR